MGVEQSEDTRQVAAAGRAAQADRLLLHLLPLLLRLRLLCIRAGFTWMAMAT